MPTSASRAASPFWYIFSNNGKFAVNGEMRTYRAINPTEYKPTYSDPACINANPVKIDLNALGMPEGWPEIYWADDEKYRVVINCNDGTEYVVDNFPFDEAGGGGGSVVGIDNDNKLVNAQFHFWFKSPVEPSDTELEIAQFWKFKKSNTSAADKITFERFNLGQDNPEATPIYYFRYLCTGAGTGEAYKDLYQDMADVRTFEQTPMAFSFAAYSDVARTVEVIFIQNFGTGGTPSPEHTVNIASINLPAGVWEKQFVTFTPPSVAGKSLGTNGDDYIRMLIRFPLDSVCDIRLTNMDLKLGDRQLPYQRLTKEQEDALMLGAMIPDIEDGDYGKAITANRDRTYSLAFPVPIGGFIEYGGQAYTDDDDWAICQGKTVSVSQDNKRYSRLFGAIGHSWGRGSDSWVATANGDKITIATTTTDAVTPPSNGSTSPGFTITQYAQASDTRNRFIAYVNNDNLTSIIIKNKTKVATDNINNQGAGLVSAATYLSGSSGRQATSMAIVKEGSAITAGQYFMVSNTAGSAFSFWYEVNGAGTAPTGSPVKIAINSTDTQEEVALKTLANMTGLQVDVVQVVAASAITSGSYINIYTHATEYYIWFKVGTIGTDPKIVGRTGILVELSSGDTAAQVATKIAARINNEFFQIPDRRGYFPRGFDPASTVDFEGRMGYGVGSVQFDQVIRHSHPFTYNTYGELDSFNGESSPNPRWSGTSTANSVTGLNSGINTGGLETRPVNVAVNYLIKL